MTYDESSAQFSVLSVSEGVESSDIFDYIIVATGQMTLSNFSGVHLIGHNLSYVGPINFKVKHALGSPWCPFSSGVYVLLICF